jgi:hypothetical protein
MSRTVHHIGHVYMYIVSCSVHTTGTYRYVHRNGQVEVKKSKTSQFRAMFIWAADQNILGVMGQNDISSPTESATVGRFRLRVLAPISLYS